VIHRASQLFLPTLREPPADAEAVNHKLLVRGAFVRQLTAGVWTFLPLGWRVHRKIEQIIREEMAAIGSQEMLMPVLTPAELWERTGRIKADITFTLKDRKGAGYVLPWTHEEVVTWHARELQSYKQLPQMLYHFSVKERDELRPGKGLIRLREFIMKDSYSFDRDEEGLQRSFELHRSAYHKIFERCGIEIYEVLAESGLMGGSESFDFLAPAGSGENTLVTCENEDYAADIEIARGVPSPAQFPDDLAAPEEVETPGQKTIEGVSEFLGVDSRATAKAMPVVADSRVVLALVRGDDRLSEMKLLGELGEEFRPAEADEIMAAFGASGGSIGPVGATVEVIADEALREGQYVVGANREDVHLRGVQAGRDFQPRFADLREARQGDRCPVCGGTLHFQTALELGHIFKLGTRYTEPLEATFLEEDGKERPFIMGSYGIGLARTMAAIIEQHHDDQGILWPKSVAPYDVHVVALPGAEEQAAAAAEELDTAGADVLLDDRDQRAGEKFADADLIGIPLRVTVGKKTLEDGAVDVRERESGEERRVALGELGGIL
jgi:prolyl-tRNA synthetase